jgi:protein-L-isoaspartate(D-aspartate) O-methyltransferase
VCDGKLADFGGMDAALKLQKMIIQKAQPLSPEIEKAFFKYPRHLFVPEYSVTAAYSDHPLLLYEKGPFTSTISQPSFVLQILNKLQIQPGHKVYELGTGSGWNAALMSALVGENGTIVTSEVIPEVAARAQKFFKELKVPNIHLIAGDGFEGHLEEAPYDRVIFTAGSSEFPDQLFAQLKDGGLMIFVRQREFESDMLELLRKDGKQWTLLSASPCQFVSVNRKKKTRSDSGSLSI